MEIRIRGIFNQLNETDYSPWDKIYNINKNGIAMMAITHFH